MMDGLRENVNMSNYLINRSQRENKDSTTAEVICINPDGTYNIMYGEHEIPNRHNDNKTLKYAPGTRVLVDIPDGDLDRCVIKGTSNFNLPTSPTIRHFSSYTAPDKIVAGVYYHSRIERYNDIGSLFGYFSTTIYPRYIDTDRNKNIYSICFNEANESIIQKHKYTGEFVDSWNFPEPGGWYDCCGHYDSNNIHSQVNPRGIAVDRNNDNILYFADYGNMRILKFDTLSEIWDKNFSGLYSEPIGITCGGDYIFVLETDRIERFTRAKTLKTFTSIVISGTERSIVSTSGGKFFYTVDADGSVKKYSGETGDHIIGFGGLD